MILCDPNPELSARWSEWLLWHDRRGMHAVLRIIVCLSPAFCVLDSLVAPARRSRWFYGTPAVVALVTLALFPVVSSGWFRRHPHAISAGYMPLLSLGSSLMTVLMGGLASPYHAGLSLLIVASGLLFVWPGRVLILEHTHERLERVERFESEFFANITHELKTPLSLMLAPLGLMIDGLLGAILDAQRTTLGALRRRGVKLWRSIDASQLTAVGGSIQVRLCDEGAAVRVDVIDDGCREAAS